MNARWWLVVVVTLAAQQTTRGQQVTIGTPLNTVSSGFTESYAVGGAIEGPNFFARWGTANGAPLAGVGPAMGGGLQGGVGFGGGGFGGGLNFAAQQGSVRGVSSVSPSVTVMNGGTGYFFHGEVTPFVIGVVPTVGSPILINAPFANSAMPYPGAVVGPAYFPPAGGAVPWQSQVVGLQSAMANPAAELPAANPPPAAAAVPVHAAPPARDLFLSPANVERELEAVRPQP